MSECDHNCASCSKNCSERKGIQKAQLNPYSKVNKVIGVISGKGGVGKSLVTSLMAVAMQKEKKQVAILDGDITGPSIPKSFGVHTAIGGNDQGMYPAVTDTGIQMISTNLLLEQETQPVLLRGPIIGSMVAQFYTDVVWTDVDYMFVDMPPGTGDVALTVFQQLPVDGIIIVTTPQELVGMIVEKAIVMANMMNVPVLGIVENMSYVQCPDCEKKLYVFGESHAQEICDKYGLELLAQIPLDPLTASLVDEGNIELADTSVLSKAVDKIKSL
ncbi:MAG: Mrp/NBP35 family ATP-binding protein [Erysipelotrichaceae bacterium]|nr:Mrp/NBP35 family ATP-binding protein [Erysipelotrichaceae bacterium]